MNGERYSGGTFLPSTRLSKQGKASKGRGFSRALVAPGELRELEPGERSLFAVFCNLSRDLVPFPEDHPCWNFFDREQVVNAIACYKQGDRTYREGHVCWRE